MATSAMGWPTVPWMKLLKEPGNSRMAPSSSPPYPLLKPAWLHRREAMYRTRAAVSGSGSPQAGPVMEGARQLHLPLL